MNKTFVEFAIYRMTYLISVEWRVKIDHFRPAVYGRNSIQRLLISAEN